MRTTSKEDFNSFVNALIEDNSWNVMVVDPLHVQGLGSKLMDQIVDVTKDLKVETVYSYVSSVNTKMINMFIKKGIRDQTSG